jgi:hypothetical protein
MGSSNPSLPCYLPGGQEETMRIDESGKELQVYSGVKVLERETQRLPSVWG